MSLEIRRAVPADTAGMIEITRNVWEGNDYVPYLWDRWLNDPHGCLHVAVLDSRLVGLQHVRTLPDGSAWLEGIRVAEDARQQGIARALAKRGLDWARDFGCRVVRLSTSSENPGSNRLAESEGFRRVGTFQPMRARPEAMCAAQGSTRLALPFDATPVNSLVNSSSQGRYFTEGWTAYQLTEDRLRSLLGGYSVVVAGDDQIRAAAIAACPEPFTTLYVGLLLGSRDGVLPICAWLRSQAAGAGLESVRATLAVGERADLARETGFEPAYDFQMLLYERELTTPAS